MPPDPTPTPTPVPASPEPTPTPVPASFSPAPTPTPVPASSSPTPTPTPVPESSTPGPTPTPAPVCSPDSLDAAGQDADSNAGDGNVGDTSSTCSAPAPTQPPASIAVHVQAPDGTPIAGVTVSVDGKGWAGVTDANGDFDFGTVPPDDYTVRGEKDGYDLTSPSDTKTAPAAMSTQYLVVLPPLHAKIDVDGVVDGNKLTIGGLIVRNFDGNNAPRKKITIGMKALPAGSKADVLLQAASDKIKLFDAVTGGVEIPIDGAKNKFASAALPKDVWVEGAVASDAMRDVDISVDVVGVTKRDDAANLTVLWVDKPTVSLSGSTSVNNDKRATYKAWTKAGTDNLGLQEYNASMGARIGWGSEASAKVKPTKFNFPANDLKLERDYDYNDFNGNAVLNTGVRSASVPPGNDTGPASARDDVPDPDDMLYDFDAAGLAIPNAAVNTIHRTRNNFWAFASITVEGKSVRCSEIRQYFIAFSQKQTGAPAGSSWSVVSPPDVVGDMAAGNGTTKLTWDLK